MSDEQYNNDSLDVQPETEAPQAEVQESVESIEINNQLKAIYSDHDGQMPDLKNLDHRRGSTLSGWLLKLIIVFVIISGAAWGGFLFWSQGIFNSDERPLTTQIEGPTEVKAGEEVFYTIRYTNSGDVPLASLEAKVSLPPGFTLTSTTPEPTKEKIWTIGSLSEGSDGAIILGGIFRAEKESNLTIQTLFTYKPANFSSDFQDLASTKIIITDSAVALDLSGPEKAVAGDDVEYIINIQNTGEQTLEDMSVTLGLPPNFNLKETDPASISPDQAKWNIDLLESGELFAITLTGQFTSSASGEQSFEAEVNFLDEQGIALTQAQNDFVTDILGGNIIFHLIADGSSKDQVVDLGEILLLSIDYENAGSEVVSDLIFTLEFSNKDDQDLPFDWETVSLKDGVLKDNKLVFDKNSISELADLEPNQSGVIDLSLPIFNTIDPETMADHFTLSLKAEMSKIGSVETPRTINTSPITVSLNSDLSIKTMARYFMSEEEVVGTGPLPPEVGETTSYDLVWQINNSLHELTDLSMTTKLPADVAWLDKGRTEIGNLSYDDTTRMVKWKIDKLPIDLKQAEAVFKVAITPSEADVGAFFKLTNTTAMQATDNQTKDQISKAQDVINTELANDELAAGKGVVVE
ncbi:hypothetical protein ACFLZY_02515 [Patescibacteria group bacterium]